MSRLLSKMFDLELSEREEQMVAAIYLNRGKTPANNTQLQEGLNKLANLPESWARELALQILMQD